MTKGFEIPKERKSPVESGDFSVFREKYEAEKKKIDDLENRIMERFKFLEKEKDPVKIKKIKDEISWLRMEKLDARERSINAYNLHEGTTIKLEDFNPGKDGGNA